MPALSSCSCKTIMALSCFICQVQRTPCSIAWLSLKLPQVSWFQQQQQKGVLQIAETRAATQMLLFIAALRHMMQALSLQTHASRAQHSQLMLTSCA